MLKKIIEWNKKLIKPLIVLNFLLIVADLYGMVICETNDLRITYFKYLIFHTISILLLVFSLETTNKKEK